MAAFYHSNQTPLHNWLLCSQVGTHTSKSAVHHDRYPHSYMAQGYSDLCPYHSHDHGSQEDSDICSPADTQSCYEYSSVCKYGKDIYGRLHKFVCSLYHYNEYKYVNYSL